MNSRSCLLSRDEQGAISGPLMMGDFVAMSPPSVEKFLNQGDVVGRCNCSMIHMASHNAVCKYCARKESAGLSGYAFD